MPCRPAATRATTMDARISILEAAFANVSTLIAEMVNSSVNLGVATALDAQLPGHLDNHLSVYFEKCHRELAFHDEGESSFTPNVADHPPPRDMD